MSNENQDPAPAGPIEPIAPPSDPVPPQPLAPQKPPIDATVAAFQKCMDAVSKGDDRIRKLSFEVSDKEISPADALSVDLCINKISKLDGRRSH
jgi:hypothetical protein